MLQLSDHNVVGGFSNGESRFPEAEMWEIEALAQGITKDMSTSRNAH